LERTVLWKHIARNAGLPVFTVAGLSLATLVEGAFITETWYGIPGIGRLAVESIFDRDYPVFIALTLIIAGAYVIANLIVDIGYSFLDPRIRYS
jgi:peptide/nickel transport system permease protein